MMNIILMLNILTIIICNSSLSSWLLYPYSTKDLFFQHRSSLMLNVITHPCNNANGDLIWEHVWVFACFRLMWTQLLIHGRDEMLVQLALIVKYTPGRMSTLKYAHVGSMLLPTPMRDWLTDRYHEQLRLERDQNHLTSCMMNIAFQITS